MIDRLSEEELRKARKPYTVSMYVHYDDNGVVTAISNSKNISNSYYEVPIKRVEPFLLGKKSFIGLTYDYFKFDITTIDIDRKKINVNLFYMVPKLPKEGCDFTIVIKKNKKQVRFVLTSESKKEIYSRNLDDKYKFYITKKNNQHFLYETVVISGKKLLSEPYADLNFCQDEFSIYTLPIFNSYGVILK